VTRAAIDIGSNSIRLLIVDDAGVDIVRRQRVTGLGRGVDSSRLLSAGAVEETLAVLEDYRRRCDAHGVMELRAVATSATRDAHNRDDFIDRAATVLGVRPDVITGSEEAELAFTGATAGRMGECVVVDIGGGSTEFVYRNDAIGAATIDIGSVRLTDRLLPNRPASYEELETAAQHVAGLFEDVDAPGGRVVVGVAGTWTSLAGILAADAAAVHDSVIDRLAADRLVVRLAALSVDETAQLPGLDPARAPVILGGAVIAREAMRRLQTGEVRVSERDLLDGVVAGLRPL
jgi:exopolyphosphatase / guanosine-5'-triphosphate,3'-diphosphate pyrophosphatase